MAQLIMEIINWSEITKENFSLSRNFQNGSALCIGSFDGPHRGHYEIFKKVLSHSDNNSLKSIIVTFSRPVTGIKKQNDYLGDISTLDQRLSVFSSLGFDYCVLIDFSEAFAGLSGEEFFSILKNKLNIKYICEGLDFKCGHKGSFKMNEIILWGKKNGVETEFIQLVLEEGERISSSKIRKMLKEHKENEARSLLTALP